MPNPIRERAQGRPFYVIQIKLWSDDVSGNRTRQWNKHENWCWTHCGIAQKLQHQEFFVHFLSTSPHATSLEQAEAITEMLAEASQGIIAFDAETKNECMFAIGVLHLPADNPMQSALSSHAGTRANCFCRRCIVGGTRAWKKSYAGYSTLFKVCPMRFLISK